MYYCPDCAKKYKWPDIGSRSQGPCEMCGKTAPCFDVPSKYLPIPKKVKDD